MFSLNELRSFASLLAFVFFGYFCPSFASIKAVLNRDIESVKEYLTYWSVLGILLYIDSFLKYTSYVRSRYPPELKVLFILWLTHPKFQGAFRIYVLLIKPYFDANEEHIDKIIEHSVNKVKESTMKQAQRMLWQLFLQPNEGLLASLIQASGSAVFSVDTAPEPKPEPQKSVMKEFSDLLHDGVLLDALISDGTKDIDMLQANEEMTERHVLQLAHHRNMLIVKKSRVFLSEVVVIRIPLYKIDRIYVDTLPSNMVNMCFISLLPDTRTNQSVVVRLSECKQETRISSSDPSNNSNHVDDSDGGEDSIVDSLAFGIPPLIKHCRRKVLMKFTRLNALVSEGIFSRGALGSDGLTNAFLRWKYV